MGLKKGVASQKIKFVMVDKTDFATPEPGITVQGGLSKDGGAKASIVNSVSEITSGLYKITLAATETNAGVATYQFTASGAADQYITVYPEDGYANKISSILADTNATLDNKIDSILADTTSILVDTTTTLDNKLDSILEDTKEINSQCDSILADVDTLESTIDGPVTVLLQSIVDDTSQILLDTATISNLGAGSDSAILSTLDNLIIPVISDILSTIDDNVADKLDSILTDTGTTLDNKIDSILADTITLSNADYGLNALETIVSDILEAIDSIAAGPIASILVDTNATLDNKIDSILEDTKKINSQCDSILADTTSILVDTTSILVDTGSTIQNDLDELTDAGALSGVRLALMLDRIYARLFHEVNVTDATGALAIRNAADDGDIATGSITDNDTLTQQTVVTWA